MLHDVPEQPPIRYATDQLALDSGRYIWNPEVELLPYKRFAETFCLLDSDYDYQPMKLLNYQITDLIGPLLGWIEADSNILRHTESLIYTPKKTGKSSLCASLLAYWCCSKEGQNCRLIASTVDQANTIFSMLVGYTRHPVLNKRWHIKDGQKLITDRITKSTIKIMPCRASGISGPKIHLLVVDEFSEFPRCEARKVWDRIKYAGAANVNGSLKIIITTPAHELDTIGYETWQRAKAIVDSENTEELRTHACVYGAKAEDDWNSEETWKKIGPHIDQLVSLDFYREEYRKAKGSPEDELGFRIYLLGQYVRSHRAYIDMDLWHKCHNTFPDLRTQKAVIGLDNGGCNDILGYSILIPHEGKVYVEAKGVISAEALRKKVKLGETEYQAWADKGLLQIIGEETIQLPQLLRLLELEYENYDIAALAYDPWQLKDLRADYEAKGRIVIETPQYGKFMNPLILEFERMIKEQTIVHSNQVLLNHSVENLQIKADKYGRLECDKATSRHKIDLAVSTITGLNALPEAQKPQWEGASCFAV